MREGIVSASAGPVTVEFFGMARARAGRAEVRALGRTVAELLGDVVRQCPRLVGVLTPSGELSRQFLVSVDGDRFVADPGDLVPTGCRLLILGADAGG